MMNQQGFTQLYQSDRLLAYADRLIHGFSGKPLTMGGPGFSAETLASHRHALCEQVGLVAENLVIPDQTHSANIRHHLDGAFQQTDAVILSEPDRPAMVMAADCVPMLLYDPVVHLGVVIHAGWRGTAQSIVAKAVHRLVSAYGVTARNLIAVIGPCARGCCYEVSDDVAEALLSTLESSLLSSESVSRFVTRNHNQKPVLNLPQVNISQLEALGIHQIDVIQACTICTPNMLWSYRRGESGRNSGFMQLL